jgi:hypothetical protein
VGNNCPNLIDEYFTDNERGFLGENISKGNGWDIGEGEGNGQ